MKDSDGEDVEGINYIEGCRRWSQEDAIPNNKSNLADGSKNCAESENLKLDYNRISVHILLCTALTRIIIKSYCTKSRNVVENPQFGLQNFNYRGSEQYC